FDSFLELFLQHEQIAGLRIPIDIEGLDLGAQEMVGAGGAQPSQAGRVVAVDESERGFVVLPGADKALPPADASAQPGEQLREERAAFGAGKRLKFCAAE